MKRIPLSQGKFAIVDDEDHAFISEWNWCLSSHGYATRRLLLKEGGGQNSNLVFMHRILNKTPSHLETDHINRKKLDNRKANLRNATRTVNCINRNSLPGSTSKYKGVSWNKKDGVWRAQIKFRGLVKYLGSFTSEKMAARAYDIAALAHQGELAVTNF